MFPYNKYLNLNALISPILHGYRNKRTWGKEKRGDIFPSFDTRLAARRPRCEVRRSAVPSGFPPTPVNPRQHLVHSDRAFREETRPNGTDFFPARRRLPQVSRSASSRCCSPRCSPRRTRRSRRTPAHTTPRTDLSASQAVSTKVKEIVSLLDGTQAGIDSAKAKYLDGYPADAGNLKTLAEDVCSTCTEGTTCASVKAVYPSVSCFLTDYIEGASSIIDDTSLNVEARSKWFRVAIQDGIPVQLAISYMEKATASAAASDWDKAAAVLLGTDADRGYAVYGRADGLARDYGTLDGADSEHNNALHSKANEKILDALEAGRTGGAGAYATQTANVIAQLKVIYAQATLRSTWGVEENLVAGTSHDKNQARGLAYFGFVLVPYVKELDTVHEKHADMISDFFDIGFSPESFDRKEYCRVLDAMEDTLNEHSANLYADFGALTAAAAVTCPATHIPGRLNLVTDAGSYWPLSDVAGSSVLLHGDEGHRSDDGRGGDRVAVRGDQD